MLKKSLFIPIIFTLISCTTTLEQNVDPTYFYGEVDSNFSGHAVVRSTGYIYVGELKNGLKHGFGISYHKDGLVEHGNWKNDKLSGYGTIIVQDVDSYTIGEMRAGKPSGIGVIVLGDDAVKGDFANGNALPDKPVCFKKNAQIDCTNSDLM